MNRRHSSKFVYIVTIMAMAVQLCVIGYHHHGTGAEQEAKPLALGYAESHADHNHHDHEHHNHEHGDHHDDPMDGDHKDCDLCLAKTAFGNTMVPQSTGGIEVVRTSTKLFFTRQDTHRHDAITWRYRARAPPSEILIS